MLKILTYSDTHLRDCGSFSPFNRIDPTTGLTYELLNILAGYDFIANRIREFRPDLVVCQGDIVQSTEIQSARVLYGMYKAHNCLMQACKEVNATHWAFDGNHDLLSVIHQISNIKVMTGMFDKIYSDPEVVDFRGFKLGVIPYTDQIDELNLQLKIMNNEADILFAHQDFNSCDYGTGIKSQSPIKMPERIHTFAGDIHIPQDVNGLLHYNGSLVQNVFQYNNLDRVGGITEIILSSSKKLTYERKPNTYSKHYIKVYDPQEVLKFKPTQAVFQVVTALQTDEVNKMLEGYMFQIVPDVKRRDEVKKSYEHAALRNDPLSMMAAYIEANNPAALELFNKIMKRKTDAEVHPTT